MSSGRHICCRPLCLKVPKDHIRIGEDAFSNALQRYAHGRVPRRYVGLAPGPLEARKRATRRRMMNLAQAGSRSFDPSVLLGLGAPECVGWTWQSPKPLTPQRTNEVAPLPFWFTELTHEEADKRLEGFGKEEDVKVVKVDDKPEQQDVETERRYTLAKPSVWEDFKECKDVDGIYNWAATYDLDVRRFPKLLFRRLCHAGQPLPVLLHALEDAAFGTPHNLQFLLNWQSRKRKGRRRLQKLSASDDIALLQQWMKRQLHLGLKSEEDILVFLRFISRVSDATKDESLRDKLITSFEGLQSSSVFGFKDLGTETQHRILEFIARGPMTRRLLELGFTFVESIAHLKLKGTDQEIAAFIASVVHAHASLRGHEESENPSLKVIPTILKKIWRLPRELACSVILITTKLLIDDHLRMPAMKAATMRLSDTWISALAKERRFRRKYHLKAKIENFLGSQKAEVAIPYLWQLREREKASFILRYWVRPRSRSGQSRDRHLLDGLHSAMGKDSPWISMFHAVHDYAQESTQPSNAHIRQVFKKLQMLRQSQSIIEIIKQARDFDAVIDESDVLYIIREHLEEQPQLAERIFHFYRELRLEKCPDLAERMILNPGSHPKAALRHVWIHSSRFLIHRDHNPREQLTQQRIQLLGKMALAYSMAPHITPRMAFNLVYACYIQHRRERLGLLSVAISRALTHAGLTRPLQAGQWINTKQVRRILSIIRSTEGTGVADGVDEMVYKWRGANVISGWKAVVIAKA